MKCGIVGLPNVGKSTLFNCLSNAKAQSANFPFCTIEPNEGVVTVPDNRMTKLSELVNPERVQPATVDIVDIAGLVKGASKGEGLGNKFLANIRETNAIIHVLRCFEDENITHVEETIDPVRDRDIIDMELQLKDLETVEKRLDKEKKLAKTGNKEAKKNVDILTIFKEALDNGQSARAVNYENRELITSMQLLTDKPVLYVCNVDEASAKDGNDFVRQVEEATKNEDSEIIVLAAAVEADIAELEEFEEKQMFLEEIGLTEPGVSRLIQKAYTLLNLQTYFTAGVKEVRAWTIKRNTLAPKAAAVIHNDFEKGFIKAEVISYDDYIEYGGESKAKEAGKLRLEGKEYIVQDGDIMHFKFNV